MEADSHFLEQSMLPSLERIITADGTSAHHVQTLERAYEGLKPRKAWARHWASLASSEALSTGYYVFLSSPSPDSVDTTPSFQIGPWSTQIQSRHYFGGST